MEWHTLNEFFQRDQLIEGFNSFIWTERYSAAGDFQIVTASTYFNRQQLAPETWIGRLGSKYIMKIDTVTDSTDDTGARNITVTGKSFEQILDDRVAMPALADTTVTPNWILTGTPGAIAREMFNQVCVVCVLSLQDSIPFYVPGTLLPVGSIPEPTEIITISAAPDSLYNTLQQICNTYDLGFRLIVNGDLAEVYFEVYTGNDLTTDQTDRNPVIFDPNMENLAGITQLTSTAVVKTVAYVIAQNGTAVVYAPDASPDDSGIARRVLLVNSQNTLPAGADLTTALNQEGVQALAAQTKVYTFDGELPPNVPFVYGVDYNLGDLVEERNSDGFGNQMLITEQIFSSDSTGEKSYPTLTLFQTITPGTWIAWTPQSQVWTDVPSDDEWGTI